MLPQRSQIIEMDEPLLLLAMCSVEKKKKIRGRGNTMDIRQGGGGKSPRTENVRVVLSFSPVFLFSFF